MALSRTSCWCVASRVQVLGLFRVAHAEEIGRDAPSVGSGRRAIPPDIGRGRVAVEEDDGRAAAFLDEGHLLPVNFSESFGLFLRRHAFLHSV